MAPKLSLAFGFQEHHELHKSSSILAEYLDEVDWDEHVKLRRRSTSVELALSSCFTSLSSCLKAVSTHAKKLYSRDRRRSMIEISSTQSERLLTRANSMPAPYQSSESDLNLFVIDNDTEGDPAAACMSKAAKTL
ncbi:hypothetical protein F444_14943 [Phytophthora nicotianae P1976]|uniref:Uncharacterized protein n=1 Tax=Phytophthora nicotianae P1976 TaxID=1317066 RepID=A0A080ZNJ3_PHYNI|nr:hypothetical protein F444_14943 [Phytophthora nicotianae P1976]